MSKKRSVFSNTQERAVAMNIKVPPETKSRIDVLKESLRQRDDSLVFNISKICSDALLAAVKQGEAELSKMGRGVVVKPAIGGDSGSKE